MRLEISQEASKESWSQQKTKWVCWSQLVFLKGEKLASHKYKELSEADPHALPDLLCSALLCEYKYKGDDGGRPLIAL